MVYRIALCLILQFLITPNYGQRFELRLSSGIGIDPSNIDSETQWNSNNINHVHAVPLDLDVNHYFHSKAKRTFFAGSGLKYLNNKYLQTFKHHWYDYGLDEIRFSQRHIILPLRVGMELFLFKENKLGFHYELQHNIATNRTLSIHDEGRRFFGTLNYQYQFSGTVNNFWSHGFSVYSKTRISEKMYLLSAIDFSIRPVSGIYDYNMDQIQQITDEQTGSIVQNGHSFSYEHKPTQTNLLTFKLGISRTLTQRMRAKI